MLGLLKREIGSCGVAWGRPTYSNGGQYADDDNDYDSVSITLVLKSTPPKNIHMMIMKEHYRSEYKLQTTRPLNMTDVIRRKEA